MNNSKNLFLGMIAGIAVGAAVGVLLAPQKGKVTRRIIRRKGEDIVTDVSDTINESIGEFSDTITKKIDKFKDDITSRLQS